MPKLTLSKTGFGKPSKIPPDQADSRRISVYIGNCRWHLKYLIEAFEADNQSDVAEHFRNALSNVGQAKLTWRNK